MSKPCDARLDGLVEDLERRYGDVPECNFTDALVDMMHAADRIGVDFGRCLDMAETHYLEEV